MFGALRRCPAPLRWSIVSQANARSIATSIRLSAIPSSKARPASVTRSPILSRSLHNAPVRQQHAAAVERDIQEDAAAEEPPSDEEIDIATNTGDITRFQELADRDIVAKHVIKNITQRMKIETMTQVQSLTINEAIKGRDVLAQAKTGTGKTLGFLLPILQNILSEDPTLISRQTPGRRSYAQRSQDVRAIVISPTRELAEQIAVEAEKLTQGTGVVVQRAVGGTQKNFHTRKMKQEGCHILIGTPGRLHDLLTDQESQVSAPKLSALVLDEADRLMDQGFWPEIQRIQKALPDRSERDRQTLMFSATMPKEIVTLVRETMKPDLHFVRTVQENEEPTHERVPQHLAVVPGLENQLPALLELCERQIKSPDKPFKAIIYFQSTAEVVLASSIFFRLRRAAVAGEPAALGQDTRIYEIHGRLSQQARTKASEGFRRCTSGILMSTDVTARGLDFPNVTHVIQVGMPTDRDTYIHRLGRTARAGAEGEGWLIMPSTALNEARVRLGKLPIKRDHSLETAKVAWPSSTGDPELDAPPEMSGHVARFFAEVRKSAHETPQDQREDVYMASLGTMQWMHDKTRLIEMMNRLAAVEWGMTRPPSIGAGIASKLRLMGVPGLNIRARGSADEYERAQERGGGRGASRSFGGDRGSSDRGGRGDRGSSSGFGSDRGRGRSFGGDRSSGRSFGGDRSSRGGFGDRPSGGRGGPFRGGDRDRRGGGRDRESFKQSW